MIKWSARGRTWEEFPPHQRWFAMAETLAHLYDLVEKNKVSRTQRSSKILYHIKAPL